MPCGWWCCHCVRIDRCTPLKRPGMPSILMSHIPTWRLTQWYRNGFFSQNKAITTNLKSCLHTTTLFIFIWATYSMCCACMQVPDLEKLAYCLSFEKVVECGKTGSMKTTQTTSKFTVLPISIQILKEGRLSSCLVDVIVIWLQPSVILCIWTLFLSPHAVLQLKLQQRRTREELVSQGIMPRKSHFTPLVMSSITHVFICMYIHVLAANADCNVLCHLILGMFVQASYISKSIWTLKNLWICALYIKISH